MYETGEGIAKDDALAVKWYRKAAEQGNAQAQCNLGTMYADGKGVVEDDALAVKWYRKAAEQADAQAQHNLGVMYATGQGIAVDFVAAYIWFDLAAAQGQEHSKEAKRIVTKEMTREQIAEAQKLSLARSAKQASANPYLHRGLSHDITPPDGFFEVTEEFGDYHATVRAFIDNDTSGTYLAFSAPNEHKAQLSSDNSDDWPDSERSAYVKIATALEDLRVTRSTFISERKVFKADLRQGMKLAIEGTDYKEYNKAFSEAFGADVEYGRSDSMAFDSHYESDDAVAFSFISQNSIAIGANEVSFVTTHTFVAYNTKDRLVALVVTGDEADLNWTRWVAANWIKKLSPELNKRALDGIEPPSSTPNANAEDEPVILATGSGFIAPSTNYVVTNYHVIEGADELIVIVEGGSEPLFAEVAGVDECNDLALLKLESSPKTEGELTLNLRPRLGEPIQLFSYPDPTLMGASVKYTKGIINSLTGIQDEAGAFQMDANVFEGSSGSGVFDRGGNLVGITQKVLVEHSDVGYAIQSPYLIPLLNQANVPYSISTNESEVVDTNKIKRLSCLIIALD
jgi:S1-C subfamily serine protease